MEIIGWPLVSYDQKSAGASPKTSQERAWAKDIETKPSPYLEQKSRAADPRIEPEIS